MRMRISSLCVAGAFACAIAAAQTAPPPAGSAVAPKTGIKISGTLQCGKSVRNAVEVGDEAGHALAVAKTPCSWSKPIELGDSKTKDGASSVVSDGRGDVSADHGYHVGTMVSGDKYFTRFDGQTKTSQGVVQTQMGRWSFTGGTGKLKGLQGRGSYTTTGNPDGTSIVQVEGEYKLP